MDKNGLNTLIRWTLKLVSRLVFSGQNIKLLFGRMNALIFCT
jgi:hypothetical protein